MQYDQVCGRITGYQIGHPESFVYSPGRSINTNYVDGISVTHGSPRQHVWTFAAGIEDQQDAYGGRSTDNLSWNMKTTTVTMERVPVSLGA